MKNKVVCITGLCGAGKSVLSDYFLENGYKYLRFGQITMDEVAKRGLPVNEANERFVREDLRKQHGMAAFAILNLPKIEELLKEGNVIADGLYSFEEYKVLKEKFGDNLAVIAVFASPKLRYERLGNRKVVEGDTNVRNRPLSVEEAKSRDLAEIENLNKGGTIAMADYTILNTKDLDFLQTQVKEVFDAVLTGLI
jgi:dephospho-CoA kinase